jgi:predicted membrane protein
MTETQLSETNWAPTRASTAIALLGTAGGVGALSSAVGVQKGVVVAVAGTLSLAVALWLLTFDRWRVPATVAASLLLVPAGAGVTAGVGYEALVAFAGSFPAGSPTGVIGQILRILGVLAVLWGCTVAVFGVGASVRGVATSQTVARCYGLVVRVAILPVGFFIALSGHALVTNFDLGAMSAFGELVSIIADWLFAPAGNRLHLLAFWLLFAAASYATYRAVRDLPIRELAGEASLGGSSVGGSSVGESSVGESSMDEVRIADLVATLQRVLRGLAVVSILGLLPAFFVEITGSEGAVRGALPDAAYGLLVALTSSGGVRHLLAWVALVAGSLALVAALARRSSQTSTQDLLVGYAPFLAGMTVVAGVGVAHRPILDRLIEFVAGRLKPPLTGYFRDASGRVVEFYGPETVVLGLTAGVLALATVGIFALYLSFALGFVSDRVAGPALAGGGLFLAAAFAGTLNVSLWLVLGSLIAALVVWDAGEFATTLGEEVGRQAKTRRVELLHALGALSVGVLGAALATGLTRVLPAGSNPAGPAGGELGGLSVALVGAIAGVVILVMALR